MLDFNQMLDFFAWAVMAFAVVATCFMVWLLNRGFQFLYIDAPPPGIYDDELAVRSFVAMLGEARESMIVYDDGEDIEGSLYNDRRSIDAVRDKLQVNPEFRLQCLFNCDDHLVFRQELASEPRVDIRIRSKRAPASAVLYKIIDGGAKAYLSRYDLGSKERRFRLVDCTGVSRRHRGRVADAVFGTYKEHFVDAFECSDSVIRP